MKAILKLLCLLPLAASCTKFFTSIGENVDYSGTVEIQHGMIVLGDQLDDPYTVENMTRAFDSLYGTKVDRLPIETTDYYVRFLPASQDDYEMLEGMGLQMLDHPMDYEILVEGDYYQDPSVGEERITWQYTVVGKDFDFPKDIRYEILDECFLPDDAATKADGVDWEAVEREAFRITGNADMLEPRTKAAAAYPEGRITIVDSELNNVENGVKGVKVSCNQFVKFAHAFTDDEGCYRMTRSFSASPRYRLMFKNKKGFGIGMNLILVPASFSTLGEAPSSGASIRIDAGSDRKLFARAVVNNAGYDYYSSCESEGFSIKTPPSNLRIWLFRGLSSSSAPMLQQGALIDNSILQQYLGAYTSLVKMFLPDITLGLKGTESYADIYALATHEFAHASHFMQVGKEYWDAYIKFILKSFVTSGFVTYGVGTEEDHGLCEVSEMWAYYIETKTYQERYGSGTVFGTSYWFYPQIFLKLDEMGIGKYKIFNALTSDITDKEKLHKKMVSLFPESKSIINQTFGRYN